MSNIVLTAAVRQNLLSLQDTAALLSTTQERLATGKKVNSALDNPTNFFTAAGLDARASDISNLLDSIGNGVQVLPDGRGKDDIGHLNAFLKCAIAGGQFRANALSQGKN